LARGLRGHHAPAKSRHLSYQAKFWTLEKNLDRVDTKAHPALARVRPSNPPPPAPKRFIRVGRGGASTRREAADGLAAKKKQRQGKDKQEKAETRQRQTEKNRDKAEKSRKKQRQCSGDQKKNINKAEATRKKQSRDRWQPEGRQGRGKQREQRKRRKRRSRVRIMPRRNSTRTSSRQAIRKSTRAPRRDKRTSWSTGARATRPRRPRPPSPLSPGRPTPTPRRVRAPGAHRPCGSAALVVPGALSPAATC